MTKTEKAKLQKRAREAIVFEWMWWLNQDSLALLNGGGICYSNHNEEAEDAAIRKELKRAVRLVRSGAK